MVRIYRVEVTLRDPALDSEGRGVLHDFQEFGLSGVTEVRVVRVYVLAAAFAESDAERIAGEFLADAIVDDYAVGEHVIQASDSSAISVEITRRAGVMDPVETSVRKGIAELGLEVDWVRISKRYVVSGQATEAEVQTAALKLLANDLIEEVIVNRDAEPTPPTGAAYSFERVEVPLAELSDEELQKLSVTGQLYLSLEEMKGAQAYFKGLGRDPTDVELETLAQTWSEHCVHKTFRGKIRYREEATGKDEMIDNLLKSTVAKVTRELDHAWCWSVFVDNAGVIDFDGEMGAVFKVETHNHPSALEPYGGAGTGIGGVIRDPLGTGLGAKPVMNTDVFCFGPPDHPREDVPKGALHPLRVMKGVVSGVRDYGNRMGIPTANGALYFDERYIGNPLVFCGNVALVPKDMAKKRSPRPGQIGIVVGGRTGRDGIHGATFSSVELDEESESVSSGAVQIGNPIEEKKVLDFILRARDAGLYSCITDCGAGGLSSAFGEMGEDCGVIVDLDKVPIKYEGLSYTEIWISEAQERMVFATDEDNLEALAALAAEENVEMTVVARFTDDKQLRLCYDGVEVGCLDMAFLHEGIPQIEREALWAEPGHAEPEPPANTDCSRALLDILGSWNVCSKEWVIRQYDHEVQANSVVKPLVGVTHDGPGDAAVIAPLLGSSRALVIANGSNPRYSDIDPYHMAASAIDEALRNVIAVGGTLERCAILDNFCWGNCDKPDRLAGLVRAARACYDVAKPYGVPFISGKDSLNNEFATEKGTVAIPGTLLISAMAVMEDLSHAITMDAKEAGNLLYIVGLTRRELGGSHYYSLQGKIGRTVPKVDVELGKRVFNGMTAATSRRLIRSAHDCSEGGIAVAVAEMAFAGGLGIEFDLTRIPVDGDLRCPEILFSESNSRFVVEIAPGKRQAFEAVLREVGAPFSKIGVINQTDRVFACCNDGREMLNVPLAELKSAWQKPLAL